MTSRRARSALIAAGITALVVLLAVASTRDLLAPSIVDIHRNYKSVPVPTGIADYGVANNSGVLSPYKISAREVVGQVTIDSISAYNSSVRLRDVATMQLNVMLKVITTRGNQTYWLQNVGFFNTSGRYIDFADEVNNDSSPNAVLNSSYVSGAGHVVVRGFYGSLGSQAIRYSIPFSFDVFINESKKSDGIVIMFGYQILRGASQSQTIYDTVLIKNNDTVAAAIMIDGSSYAPRNLYYDAELIFGGPPSAQTTFTSMNASLDMYYVTINGSQARPHYVWEFGSDTAEGAYNLETSMVNGMLVVTLGRINFFQSYPVG